MVIMKSIAKIIAGLALTGLLGGCSGTSPPRSLPALPPSNPKPRLTGKWITFRLSGCPVNGPWRYCARLQRLRDAQTQPYFRPRPRLSYPPREVTFIALKQEKKLELWARGSGEFRFIRDYDIQAASGVAGPKLRQGDRQVPEGIYPHRGLNPNSHYHLSMKINTPNEFDLFHAWEEGRADPGSDIFIHGKAASSDAWPWAMKR